MPPILFVDELPPESGLKWVSNVGGVKITVYGCYCIGTETIYINNSLCLAQKIWTTLHELGHWVIDKTVHRLRYHFWYDYVTHFYSLETIKSYIAQADVSKKTLPYTFKNKKVLRW